jgi:hypothetical protein
LAGSRVDKYDREGAAHIPAEAGFPSPAQDFGFVEDSVRATLGALAVVFADFLDR